MHDHTNNFDNALPAELRLLLLCSKLKIEQRERQVMDQLLVGAIDWDFFVYLTLHHKVYPIVYRYLSTLSAVPKEALLALQQQTNKNISQTLPMMAELVRVLKVMGKNGINVVVMKGFPLAYQLYKDITLRPSRDLDILIPPEELDKARMLIEENGYVLRPPISNLTPDQLKRWMKSNQHIEYWQPDKGILLEIHWRLDCHGMDIPLSQVKNSLIQVQIAGQSISILGKEESLLYLVLHGAVHAWFRLKWLYDVDAMVRQRDFCWTTLYQLADRLAVRTVLNQTVILLWELLQTPIPIEFVTLARKDKHAEKLAYMALQFIKDHDYEPKSRKVIALLYFQWRIYQFYLQSKWKKRFSFIFRCFLPSKEDLAMVSLPANLYFLYYILSPFSWIGRRIQNIARRYTIG